MKKIENIQEVYDSEVELIKKQSSLLLQRKSEGFNGELKTSGLIVENYIKEIIKKHIPNEYRICSGYIATTESIKNTDNLAQYDLIIVDDRIPPIYKFGVSDIEIIAGRGLVVRQLRILASQFRVLRTGTLSEIRPDNMYQPLCAI